MKSGWSSIEFDPQSFFFFGVSNLKRIFSSAAAATPAPVQPQPSPPRQCQNDWSTQCAAHNQCCSGLCEKLGNQRLGTCKPSKH